MLLLSVSLLLLARATTFRLTAISLWLPRCFALPCSATADMPDPCVHSSCNAVDDSISTTIVYSTHGQDRCWSGASVASLARSDGERAESVA